MAALPIGLMTGLAAGGSAIGALPDLIPSKYERENKKKLQELQRKQEMGLLGLTDREIANIQNQMRGTQQQAQQYAAAERQRLTSANPQYGQQLMSQQLTDESRQRLEADLASQILGMDLSKKQQQEAQIEAMRAVQADINRRRFEAAVSPFETGAETAVGQIGMERMLGNYNTPEQAYKQAAATALGQQTATSVMALPAEQRQQVLTSNIGLSSDQAQLFSTQTPVASPTPTISQDELARQAALDLFKQYGFDQYIKQ